MLGRHRMRKLLAASLYEALPEAEGKKLDAALARDVTLRNERDQLQRLVRAVPRHSPEPEVDVLALVQRRLREADSPARAPRRLALAGAMGGVVLLLATVGVWYAAFSSQPTENATVNVARAASPVAQAVETAHKLVYKGQYTPAYRALAAALDATSDDPAAPEAQVMLARIAFENLKWYPEADRAYEKFLRLYPDVYSASPDRKLIWERHELLTEAARVNYASLMELDSAEQARGSDALPRFERVMARYPQTLAAARAAQGSAQVILTEKGGLTAVEALREARTRCTNPVAVAQLSLEMGHIYANQLQDRVAARTLYEEAAKVPELAQVAEASLERIAAEALPAQGS